MTGSSYDSNFTDRENGLYAPTENHRLLKSRNDFDYESSDSSTRKSKSTDMSEQRTSDSEHGDTSSYVSLKNEFARDVPNGYADNSSESPQTLHEFPFSTARVWISTTLIMIIYIVVVVSTAPLTAQYLFYRFSMDYHHNVSSTHNKETCANSTNTGDTSMAEAQRDASNTILYSTIASCIPAFFACLFAGSISDFLGRKVLLISSLSGITIKNIILCLIIKFNLNVQLIYLGSAIDGIAGSLFTTTVAVTSIISDVTPKGENKAIRFSIIEGVILIASALSQLAVGYLIKGSFFVPALACVCLLIVALFITVFILPDTLRKRQDFSWNIVTHIKKTFRFYYTKGSTAYSKYQFIIGLAIHFFMMLTNLGKSSIETMYVLNKPICWSSVDIGIFSAVKMVVMSFAAVLLLGVCKNRLSLEIVGMICGTSSAAGLILEAFADSTLMMYLSVLAGILFTTALPLPRAILSQIASPSEQGALFSSMSCTEAIATLVSTVVYTLIYNATLETFRGAVFMVMASMCVLTIILFGMYRFFRQFNLNKYEYIADDSLNTSNNYESN